MWCDTFFSSSLHSLDATISTYLLFQRLRESSERFLLIENKGSEPICGMRKWNISHGVASIRIVLWWPDQSRRSFLKRLYFIFDFFFCEQFKVRFRGCNFLLGDDAAGLNEPVNCNMLLNVSDNRPNTSTYSSKRFPALSVVALSASNELKRFFNRIASLIFIEASRVESLKQRKVKIEIIKFSRVRKWEAQTANRKHRLEERSECTLISKINTTTEKATRNRLTNKGKENMVRES